MVQVDLFHKAAIAFKLHFVHVTCFQYISIQPSIHLPLCSVSIHIIFPISLSAGAPHAGSLSSTCVCV